MDRIARSFRLVQQSYRILMRDSELMFLPFISGAITLVVVAAAALGFGISEESVREGRIDQIALLLLLFIMAYTISIFFQAAVIAGATERLRGGDPTMRSALAAAWRRIGSILAWAVVAATVGIILNAIHERAGWLGKLVTLVIGVAWSFATFFIVPVIVLEHHSVGDSFRRSWETFKKTWGEAVVGAGGMGIASFLAWISLAVVVSILVLLGLEGAAFVTAFTAGIVLLMFFAALEGVYVAALYRFATEGVQTAGFDHDLLSEAFVLK